MEAVAPPLVVRLAYVATEQVKIVSMRCGNLLLLVGIIFTIISCKPPVDYNNDQELTKYLQGTWVTYDNSTFSDVIVYDKIVISGNTITYYMKLGNNDWGEPEKVGTFTITDKIKHPLSGNEFRGLYVDNQGLKETLKVFEDGGFYYGNQKLKRRN